MLWFVLILEVAGVENISSHVMETALMHGVSSLKIAVNAPLKGMKSTLFLMMTKQGFHAAM